MRALLTWIRTSSWAPIVVRAALGAGGLVVLGVVGAAFGSPPPSRATAAATAVQAEIGGLPLTASLTAAGAGASLAPLEGGAPALPPPAPSALPTSESGARGRATRATTESPVHVNEADETELRRLPGVGAKRAAAIVELRQRLGRFRRIEDLLRVKGVGRATVRRWRPLVRLEPRAAPLPPEADGGAAVPTS